MEGADHTTDGMIFWTSSTNEVSRFTMEISSSRYRIYRAFLSYVTKCPGIEKNRLRLNFA